jgi:prefoldin subunit 5
MSPEQEVGWLKQQAEAVQEQLQHINERISELSPEPGNK